MPWYRIYADHGPGHQSSSEHYRFYEKPLDKAGKRDAWDEIFDDGRHDYPIGDVELVDKLPQHIYDGKVASAQASIQSANKMLEILTKTKTKPVIAVRFATVAPNGASGKLITGFEARTLAPSSILGPLKPTREKAVNALIRVLNEGRTAKERQTKKSDFAVISR